MTTEAARKRAYAYVALHLPKEDRDMEVEDPEAWAHIERIRVEFFFASNVPPAFDTQKDPEIPF